jgi:hypothetical protein
MSSSAHPFTLVLMNQKSLNFCIQGVQVFFCFKSSLSRRYYFLITFAEFVVQLCSTRNRQLNLGRRCPSGGN